MIGARNFTRDPVALALELLRYLALAVDAEAAGPGGALSPSPFIDAAWHALMLNPRLYFEVCKDLRGPSSTAVGALVLVEHDSGGARDSDSTRRVRNERTLAAYRARYLTEAPANFVNPHYAVTEGANESDHYQDGDRQSHPPNRGAGWVTITPPVS